MARSHLNYANGDDRVRNRPLATDVLLIGAVVAGGLLALGLLGRAVGRRRHQRHHEAHVEKIHDKTLKDSFPASDPPASQYFDIPVNRQ